MTVYTAQIREISATEIEVSRRFAAPRDLVFRAFTEPELMQRWLLGPPGWTMPVCEMDLRVGGAYRWEWQSETEDARFGFHGTFLEVVTPERLVETQYYDPGSLGGEMGFCTCTLVFAEVADETVVTTWIAYETPEAMQAALATGMTEGMEMSYQQLDLVLRAGLI